MKDTKFCGCLSMFIALCMSALFTSNIYAESQFHTTIDIYGTKQISAEEVRKNYGNELNKMAEIVKSGTLVAQSKAFAELQQKVISGINKLGHFSFVKISPTLYPSDQSVHITVDVVDQEDKKRLAYFLDKPEEKTIDPDHLIQQWLEYDKLGLAYFYKNKKYPEYKSCPAYHCIYGFDYPALKKYEAIFTTQVPKDQQQLVTVLRKDKDPASRAAAALLLAHIKNENELIKILIPSIRDSDDMVRNNVMRVLGVVLAHSKPKNFPIKKVVTALDYPDSSDRNKALFVLSDLISQPVYSQYLVKHAAQKLVDILHLEQPNNHDYAYEILKRISGKNYGDRDYKAWEQWVSSQSA